MSRLGYLLEMRGGRASGGSGINVVEERGVSMAMLFSSVNMYFISLHYRVI